MIRSEHTANLALSQAPAVKVGANFAKPIPRLQKPAQEKTFVQRLLNMKKRV